MVFSKKGYVLVICLKNISILYLVLSVTKIDVIWQFDQNRSSGTLHKDKNSLEIV